MANNITIKTSAYDGRYYQLYCTQTKNIAANSSTINWTLSAIGGNVNFYTVGATKVVINGVTVYDKPRVSYTTETFPAAKGSVSGTTTVAHNAAGDATISVSLSTAIYTTTQRSASASWELDSIPRAATITSAPDFNDEQTSLTISYVNNAGTAAEKIEACIALYDAASKMWHSSGANYREVNKSLTSYTFNLTAAEQKTLRAAVTKQDGTNTVRFYLRTTIGGTYYYNSVEKQFSLINFTPTITPTIRDIGEVSTKLTGNPQWVIKGFNHIEYNIGGAGRKEGYITNQRITCGSQTTTEPTGYLTNVDSAIFDLRVIDNRNTITESKVTLGLIEYKALTCNLEASIMLDTETTSKIDFTVKGNYWSGNFGAADNELKIKYRIKSNYDDYGEWIDITDNVSINAENNTYTCRASAIGLDYQSTHTIQAIAIDKVYYGGIVSTEIKLKTIPIFDWGENDFNFNVPISINNVEQDYIVESGKSGIWNYEKWNSGKARCWGTYTLRTAINAAWGSLYVGNSQMNRIEYPFAFIEKPVETVTIQSADYAAWIYALNGGKGVNGTYASAQYNVVRPTVADSTQTFYLSFEVIGKWR